MAQEQKETNPSPFTRNDFVAEIDLATAISALGAFCDSNLGALAPFVLASAISLMSSSLVGDSVAAKILAADTKPERGDEFVDALMDEAVKIRSGDAPMKFGSDDTYKDIAARMLRERADKLVGPKFMSDLKPSMFTSPKSETE